MTSTDWLILTEADRPSRVVPIIGQLLVGRKSGRASDASHLLLDDPAVSREHFEIRIDPADGVVLVDNSTNGTRVNGNKVEREVPLPLRDGDFVEIGTARMSFRSFADADRIPDEVRAAVRTIEHAHVVTVVGDVVDYTALAERDGEQGAQAATEALFAELRELLSAHGATVNTHDGDSLFAAWDVTGNPEAAASAVGFALAASELLAGRTAGNGDGAALQMGWGVTLGDPVAGHPSAARDAVRGDAINLAYRLSSLAARDGEAPVLVSAATATAAPDAASYGDLRELEIRGRSEPAAVHGAEPAAA